MGTTLTGTTPQDTYDSLIKVTDNGPLSGTAKYLSDGLGNDSVLSLSTATVGVGTASNSYTAAGRGNLNIAGSAGAIIGFQIGGTPKGYVFHDSTNLQLWNEVAGDLLFGANATERMRILSGGNVGIGTSVPASKLHLVTGSTYGAQINTSQIADTTTRLSIGGFVNDAAGGNGSVAIGGVHHHAASAQSALTFYTNNGSNLNEVGRFLATGGLTFNGDTAAANALDDYEEGTWTMGVTFGGAAVGLITSNNTGTYTKIGRQVTVNGLLQLTSKGSSTGIALLTGLPFTIPASVSNYAAASIWFNNISFVGQFSSIGTVSTTRLELWDTSSLGVITALTNSNFANNSEVMISFTYFV